LTFLKTIEFKFVEKEFEDEEEEQAYWPEVKLDMSGVESVVEPLVLKILALAYSKSIEQGAKYNMDLS